MYIFIRKIFNYFVSLGSVVFFVKRIFTKYYLKIPLLYLVLMHAYQFGVKSVILTTVMGIFTGLVLAAQSFYQLSSKGLSDAVGFFVVKSMLVEIGPALTAIVITGRIGAAITASLASMNVSEQINAMKTMQVNYMNYLVLPRVIAAFICQPMLSFISSWGGILSGFLFCFFVFKMPISKYWCMVLGNIVFFDVCVALLKSLIFGFIIVVLSSYYGLKSDNLSKLTVGFRTTKSVVTSYVTILITNFLITLLINRLETL